MQGQLRRRTISAQEQDSLLVLEGDQARLLGELRTVLKADPEGWRDLMDFLGLIEDSEIARKIAGMLSASLDVSGEAMAAGILGSGAEPKARKVGVAFLGGLETPRSRFVLLTAARDDGDVGVRHAALMALVQRPDRESNATAAAEIEEFLKTRSKTEPDEELRNIACRAVGEPVSRDTTLPPPPPRPKPLSSPPKPARPAGASEPPK